MKYIIKKPIFRLLGMAMLSLLAMVSNNAYAGQPDHKMLICHYPPGNTANPQVISIDKHAWLKHEKLHGDDVFIDTMITSDEELALCSGNNDNIDEENAAVNIGECDLYSGDGLVFTIDNPLVQESTAVADDLVTYDFEAVADWGSVFRAGTGVTTIRWDGVGVYTGADGVGEISVPTQYGAAEGVGKYLFIRNTVGQSVEDNPGVTLIFDAPVAYFGFWWSAGDHANRLQVTLVDGTVMDVETGLVWNSAGFVEQLASVDGHMGNPTGPFLDQNSDEPYAYLNLTSKDECSKIAKVRFHGRNFETDNHTVTTELIDPPGTLIPLAPHFGHGGRFNLREINKLKVNVEAGGDGAIAD